MCLSFAFLSTKSVVIQPNDSFYLYFIAALLMGVSLLIFIGIRKKYSFFQWITFVFFVTVFFIIGLHSLSYSFYELKGLIIGNHPDLPITRYAPGGLLFGVLAIILAKSLLGIRGPISDQIIFVLPLLGIIQRIGCFFNGCCHGTPTTLPWAVYYTPSYFDHTPLLQLTNPDPVLTGFHPIQLYTLLGYGIILFALLKLKHRLKVNGDLMLLGMILLCLLRFLMDFLRAHPPGNILSQNWYGLTMLQWIIIPITILLAFIVYYKEQNIKPKKPVRTHAHPSSGRVLWVFTFLILLTWCFRHTFDLADVIVLGMTLAITLVAFAYSAFKRFMTRPQWISSLIVCCIAILTMSQITVDSTGATQVQSDKNKGWISLGIGIGGGAYNEYKVVRDCSGNETRREAFPRNHFAGGINLNYNLMPKVNHHFRVGIAAYYYQDKSTKPSNLNVDSHFTKNYFDRVIFPNLSYDFRGFGIGVGLHFPLSQSTSYFHHFGYSSVVPAGSLRFGVKKYFFGEIKYLWDFPISGMPATFQIGGGSGFGKDNLNLSVGFAYINEHKNSAYISLNTLVNNRVSLNFNTAFLNKFHGSVGVKVHLGKHAWVPRKNSR